MLSIITINYNGAERTIRLLESLAKQTDSDFKVYVIDNASEESDFQTLKNCSTCDVEQVDLIRNSENLGFSGGCNTGIKKALENGSEWVVLLNNDTWVESDFISRLKANLEGKGGLMGIPLIEDNHTAYAGQIEWLKPTLDHIYTIDRLAMSINYAVGAGIAVHKSVFEKIGMLDENYFLYFEDADFSIKAKKAGISVSFLEEPKAPHQVSATTSKLGSPLLLRYHYRNALYFNFKNGPFEVKAALPFWSFWMLLKQAIKYALGNNREVSKAIIQGVLDYHLGKMGRIMEHKTWNKDQK